jgi:hypothetical protein
MEGNEELAKRREANFRSEVGRRRRWTTRKWINSRDGNLYLNNGRYRAVIVPRADGQWGFLIRSHEFGTFESPRFHSTVEAAKLNSFNVILVMKAYLLEDDRPLSRTAVDPSANEK